MCAQVQLFSCIPCLVQYGTREEQTAHLRSDLHGYNLRRRVADLQPITADEYARKRQLLEESAQFHEPTLTTHNSKGRDGQRQRKRAVNASSLVGPQTQLSSSPTTTEAEDEVDEVLPTKRVDRHREYDITCSFFDNHVAESLEANLAYMHDKYAFVIPDAKYVIDMAKFVDYLGRKIFEGHQCLHCNRPAKSLEAVRQHMSDRGHRRIGTHLEEQVEEYQDFYDYSTSYKELFLPSETLAALGDALADDGDDDWEVVEEYEDVGADGEEELRLVRVAQDLPLAKSGKAEKTWDEQLAAMGVKRAYLNHSNNLVLPSKGLSITNRKNLVHGRLMLDPRGGPKRASRVPIGMLTNNAHDTQVRVAAKRDGTKIKKETQRSQLRLGVKSNTLYRYIARKNKIFI